MAVQGCSSQSDSSMLVFEDVLLGSAHVNGACSYNFLIAAMNLLETPK